jgi:hypothetical protein
LEKDVAATIQAPNLLGYSLDVADVNNYSDGTLGGIFGEALVTPTANGESHTFYYTSNMRKVYIDAVSGGASLPGYPCEIVTALVGENVVVNAPVIGGYELVNPVDITKTHIVDAGTAASDNTVTFDYKVASGNVRFEFVDEDNPSTILVQMFEDVANGTATSGLAPSGGIPLLPTGWVLKSGTGTPSSADSVVDSDTVITYLLQKDMRNITVKYYETGTTVAVAAATLQAGQVGALVDVVPAPTDLATGYVLDDSASKQITVSAGGTNEVIFYYSNNVASGKVTVLGYCNGELISYSVSSAITVGSPYSATPPSVTGYANPQWRNTSDSESGFMPDGGVTVIYDYAADNVDIPIYVQDSSGNPLVGVSYINGTHYANQNAQVGSTAVIYAPHLTGYNLTSAASVTFNNVTGAESATFVYAAVATPPTYINLTVKGSDGTNELTSYTTQIQAGTSTMTDAPTLPNYVLDNTNIANYSDNTLSGVFGKRLINSATDTSHTFVYKKNTASVVVDFIDQATTLTITGQSQQQLTGIIGETLTINAPIIADYELISGEQSTKTAVVGTDAGITFTYERMSGNIIIKAVEQGNTSNVLGMWSDTATVGASYTPTPQNFTGWITPVATAVTAADGMIITLEYTKDVADITVHYVEQGTATTVATDTIMTAQQIGTNVYVIAQPTDLAAGYTISGLPYQTLTVASGTNEVTFEYVRGTGVITILGKYSGNVIHYSTQNANLGTAYGPIAAPNITGYTSGTWDSNSDPVSGTMPAHDITIVFDYALNSTQIPVKVQDPSGNALPGITYQNGLIYKTEAAQIGGSITIYAPHFAGYTIVGASTAPFSNINGSESATFEYVPLAANFVKLTVNANVGATTLTSFVVLVEKNVATTIEAPTVPGYVLDTANDENYSNGDKLTGVFGEYEVNPAADSTHTFYYTKNTASVVVDFIDQATTLTITGQSPQNLSGIVGETLTINAPIIADYELISGEQSTKTAVVGTDASITFTYKKMNGNVLFQYAEDGNTSHILAQTRENVAIGTQTAGLAPNTLPQIPTGWALKSGTGTPSANDATVTANTVITFLLVKEMETITIHYYEDGTTTDVASDTQVSAQLGETLYVLAEPTNLNAGYNLKDLPYQQYTVVSGANEVIFYYEPIVAGEGILTVLGYSGGNVIHYSTQTITAGDPYGTVVAPSISGYKNGTWRNTSDLVSGTMTESGITVIFDYDEDTTDISIIITDEQSNALSGVTYQNQSSKLWKTQTAQTGSDVTIYAPSFVGYTIVGKASEDLTNIQGGASATFTYKTVTTTIPQIDIPIIVVDEQGNTLSGVTYLDITNKIYTTQSVQQGSNITIYAPAIAGFEVVGATSKPIASAQATDDATFVYKAISNVPSPPTDGKLTVIVTIAETGATQQGAKVKINGTEYTTDAGGKVEINPAEFKAYSLEASYSGYNNASANVTLGVANPEQIVYLALGKTTSGGGGSSSGGGGGSSTSTATLKIKCVDEKGNDIFVQSLTTVVGNKETVRALLIDGYKLAQGEPNEQEITIKSGENIVTFKYVKEGDKPTPPPDNGNRIEDMLEMDEHIKYIGGYVENGAALVKPDNSITRAETAMIFFRLLKDEGKNASIDSEFSDVRDDEWFTQAVCYLAKIGILNGYYENGESIFKPNQSITRAEFTAIAQRFDEIVNGNRNPFSDLSDDHWAYFYILSAYEKGWIGGYPDGSFKPGNPITRAEVVTIVNKMLNRKIHKDDIPQELWTKFSDLHSNQWYFADIIEASTEHDYARNDDDWETWTDYEDQSISTNSQPPEPTETPESTPPTPEPPPTEPSPTPPSAEPFADYIIYTVVSGDNLWDISVKYRTTVDKIKEINNLASDSLQIGQKLKIPK